MQLFADCFLASPVHPFAARLMHQITAWSSADQRASPQSFGRLNAVQLPKFEQFCFLFPLGHQCKAMRMVDLSVN